MGYFNSIQRGAKEKMKNSFFFILCLALLILPGAYATYWTPPEEYDSAYRTEEENTGFLAKIKQGFEGTAKAVVDTFGVATSSVGAFFSSLNQWTGEAVFLLRMAYWILLIVAVQIFFIAFWVFIIKVALKGYILYELATDPIPSIQSIGSWLGTNLKASNISGKAGLNRSVAVLKLLSKL